MRTGNEIRYRDSANNTFLLLISVAACGELILFRVRKLKFTSGRKSGCDALEENFRCNGSFAPLRRKKTFLPSKIYF